MRARDQWKRAKSGLDAEIRNSRIRLTDGFGPSLDDVEKGITDIDAQFRKLADGYRKLQTAVKAYAAARNDLNDIIKDVKKRDKNNRALQTSAQAIMQALDGIEGKILSDRFQQICFTLRYSIDRLEEKLGGVAKSVPALPAIVAEDDDENEL